MHSVEISLGDRSYPIVIGSRIFPDGLPLLADIRSTTAVVVSNTTVARLHLAGWTAFLATVYPQVRVLELPDGEEFKNGNSLDRIFTALLEWGCDRKTVLFALGGGVIGDVTGFAAATYMRGIAFVQIPTTLLAQVDSSVGGKTAINHRLGKNMIGAFYQPRLVICDLEMLATLPQRELSAGLAEVIKYGPIADMALMDWLEASLDAVLAKDRGALAHVVRRSCEIKAWVVGQDEKETGLRAILNFGHTFAHAIEAGMGYGVWLHGEAVAAGMVMAAELSRRLGLVDGFFVQRLTTLIQRAGLPVRGPVINAADNAGRYLDLMRVDKKSEAGEIRFVVIDGPGKAALRTASDALVREVIGACCG
ncbi:3-dehydroquinate synthase [Verminephrobacter aporrectodeae subsp. tuberculatae]|uniref:3-dehydroquinate synthase n=1 Tax=Verminephrobacter aporrectodeae subsp. tuberculatae TaxID=1110392 RepID=A0ABT3KU59_9BURK|nr:3-dehydroquinate synthase [Verminephrobacter aporrectodeae]MCW5321848.1 3-dehydroquinate synthase [Verminephrobacter aporrectodeae subsp. tuberculatae]